MTSEVSFIKIPEEEFVKEAISIIEIAKSKNIVLRMMGALAIYIHSLHEKSAIELYNKIGRFAGSKYLFTDLDVVAYSKQRGEIMKLFEKDLQFKYNILLRGIFALKRLIYIHPKDLYSVDIFFDKLEFSHDVVFGLKPGHGRLELDYPTISLSDLVLEKVQIHRINMKDVVDLMVLFTAHKVSKSEEKEKVNCNYIASVLSADWGFWYDAINNLDITKKYAGKLYLEKKLSDEVYNIFVNRVDELLKIIDETPKTKEWKKRAKIGTSKPWYREVEEIVR